jgi:hypothetical protein
MTKPIIKIINPIMNIGPVQIIPKPNVNIVPIIDKSIKITPMTTKITPMTTAAVFIIHPSYFFINDGKATGKSGIGWDNFTSPFDLIQTSPFT